MSIAVLGTILGSIFGIVMGILGVMALSFRLYDSFVSAKRFDTYMNHVDDRFDRIEDVIADIRDDIIEIKNQQ